MEANTQSLSQYNTRDLISPNIHNYSITLANLYPRWSNFTFVPINSTSALTHPNPLTQNRKKKEEICL